MGVGLVMEEGKSQGPVPDIGVLNLPGELVTGEL